MQALLRRLHGKRTADPGLLLLVVRDSRDNRAAIRFAGDVLASAFPAEARAGLARLRQGLDPGGDVLLAVDWDRRTRPTA